MKFVCESDKLSEAVNAVAKVASTNNHAMPVHTATRISVEGDKAVIEGGDGDINIGLVIEVEGEQDGQVALPAKLLSQIVSSLTGDDVTVSAEGDNVVVKSGKSKFTLRCVEIGSAPEKPAVDGETCNIDGATLAAAARQVTPFASKDPSRAVLNGVLAASQDDGMQFAATDSYRMAVRNIPGASFLADGTDAIIPARAIDQVLSTFGATDTIDVTVGSALARFSADDRWVDTRLIKGEYPNFRQLIPTEAASTLTIDRAALLAALKRQGILVQSATDATKRVELTITPAGVRVHGNGDQGQGDDEIEAEWNGEGELTVGYNNTYLQAALDAAAGENARISFSGTDLAEQARKPAVIRGEDEDYLALVMPVTVR